MDQTQDLKRQVDIQQVTFALGLKSNAKGKRFFCPHCQTGPKHKTPDLVIVGDGFYCHKCNAKGDVIQLIQDVRGCDFKEAIKWIEDYIGGAPPQPKTAKPKQQTEAIPVSADIPAIYEDFLNQCRPTGGKVLEWFTSDKGISPKVVERMQIKFCGKEYMSIIKSLTDKWGNEALVSTGIKRLDSKTGKAKPAHYHYFAKKAGFCIFPYIQNGKPVYLKTRPPISKAEAEQRGIIRFLNPGTRVPCLYNVDVLGELPAKILICEGETDTLSALSHGYEAVGIPGWTHFKKEWVGLFRDFRTEEGRSIVHLVLDADKAGEEGTKNIARMFLSAGIPAPLAVKLPQGMDLSDFLNNPR